MLQLKKILISFLIIIPLIISAFGEWLQVWPKIEKFWWDSTGKIAGQTIGDIQEWPKTFTDKLNWILHLPQKADYPTSLWYVIAMIQIAIDWLLWILAFIAIIYILYCWFLVFSSWSDDKNAAKGRKWISTGAIALAWIGLSWLIISAIMRVVDKIKYLQ